MGKDVTLTEENLSALSSEDKMVPVLDLDGKACLQIRLQGFIYAHILMEQYLCAF